MTRSPGFGCILRSKSVAPDPGGACVRESNIRGVRAWPPLSTGTPSRVPPGGRRLSGQNDRRSMRARWWRCGASSTPPFQSRSSTPFDEAITQDGGDVVVDLADVEFIGAGWIGTPVRSRARLEMQDRELTLRSAPRVVHRLLELCGLAYLIEPLIPARSHGGRRLRRTACLAGRRVDARVRYRRSESVAAKHERRAVRGQRPQVTRRAGGADRRASRGAGGNRRAPPTRRAHRRVATPRRDHRPSRSRPRGSARRRATAPCAPTRGRAPRSRPSRSRSRRAPAWHAAIAACTWYGPGCPRRSAPSSSSTPSAIAPASQRVRSCSSSGIRSPASSTRRAGRR